MSYAARVARKLFYLRPTGSSKPITDTVHRLDDGAAITQFLQLSAQITDMYVYRTILGALLTYVCGSGVDLLPCQNSTLTRCQEK